MNNTRQTGLEFDLDRHHQTAFTFGDGGALQGLSIVWTLQNGLHLPLKRLPLMTQGPTQLGQAWARRIAQIAVLIDMGG